MRKNFFLNCVIILSILLGTGSHSFASMQDDLLTAKGDIEKDYQLFSSWIGDELSKPLSFLPGVGPDLPANILSLPHFEVGISLGAAISKLDRDSFYKLSTKTVNPTEIDLPKTLAIPLPNLQGKIGLPSFLPILGNSDVGIKFGTFSYEVSDCDIEQIIYGIQLRKEILKDGLTGPGGISINLSFDKMEGSFKLRRDYKYISPEVYGNTNYNQDVDSASQWNTEWNINSIGAMAMYSKKLGFVNLFLGAGVDQNSGSVDTKIETTGTLTLSEIAVPFITTSDTIVLTGSSSSDPHKSNVRMLGGVEFGLTLFKFGLSGEYIKDNYALTGNARFQF